MGKALKVPTGVRAAVLSRDSGFCARCGINVSNIPSAVHHRRSKGMGGSRDYRINDPRNLVLVCGAGNEPTGCHGQIHSNPVQARDDGWTLRSLDDLDQPMRTVHGTRLTLNEDGSRTDHWPFDDVAPDLPPS